MKKINWKTGTGQEAEVTVQIKEVIYNGRHKGYRIDVSATIDGVDTGGLGNLQEIKHPVAVAAVGKLAMTKENADRVQGAIDELKNHKMMKEQDEKEAKKQAEIEEYEEGYKRIINAMNQ